MIKKTIISWSKFLENVINDFNINGYSFNLKVELNAITIANKLDMTYIHYLNQPKSMLKRKLNENLARNPRLINSLNRSDNHPLIRKYSHIPFDN